MQELKNNYGVILADPPWNFKTRSAKGQDRPQHYGRMSIADIKGMPIKDACAKNCWLFLWTTSPHLELAFDVMNKWGFRYSSMAFTWVKLNPKAPTLWFNHSDLHVGMGYTTRKNTEFCLLGRRGHPKRLAKDVREMIISTLLQYTSVKVELYSPTGVHDFLPLKIRQN